MAKKKPNEKLTVETLTHTGSSIIGKAPYGI